MGHITAARCNVYHKAIIVICGSWRGAAGKKGGAARRGGGARAALTRTAGGSRLWTIEGNKGTLMGFLSSLGASSIHCLPPRTGRP
ncbi:hypothetical protein E2C01_047715 [Portunus trituberculatus]|uniref:Uncharacterized protein n=1 Tax=Portunus trituberculatus TaxID=210409 RepID=A0A5B7GBA0_PORTR|nr:hypothetical protein [Portunus trituberculatus]